MGLLITLKARDACRIWFSGSNIPVRLIHQAFDLVSGPTVGTPGTRSDGVHSRPPLPGDQPEGTPGRGGGGQPRRYRSPLLAPSSLSSLLLFLLLFYSFVLHSFHSTSSPEEPVPLLVTYVRTLWPQQGKTKYSGGLGGPGDGRLIHPHLELIGGPMCLWYTAPRSVQPSGGVSICRSINRY